MTPQERAVRSAKALGQGDSARDWLGITLRDVDEGRATLELTVQPHHANGHGMCHGGITFALADTAFAYACNSRNQAAVAQTNSITYLRPTQLGDTLTARAHEVGQAGRSGITDVIVTNQDGDTIANFRGVSRIIKGQLFSEDEDE